MKMMISMMISFPLWICLQPAEERKHQIGRIIVTVIITVEIRRRAKRILIPNRTRVEKKEKAPPQMLFSRTPTLSKHWNQ